MNISKKMQSSDDYIVNIGALTEDGINFKKGLPGYVWNGENGHGPFINSARILDVWKGGCMVAKKGKFGIRILYFSHWRFDKKRSWDDDN